MTWGMFAIEWLELNQIDKANSLFARQFDNVRAPFYVSVSIFKWRWHTVSRMLVVIIESITDPYKKSSMYINIKLYRLIRNENSYGWILNIRKYYLLHLGYGLPGLSVMLFKMLFMTTNERQDKQTKHDDIFLKFNTCMFYYRTYGASSYEIKKKYSQYEYYKDIY